MPPVRKLHRDGNTDGGVDLAHQFAVVRLDVGAGRCRSVTIAKIFSSIASAPADNTCFQFKLATVLRTLGDTKSVF